MPLLKPCSFNCTTVVRRRKKFGLPSERHAILIINSPTIIAIRHRRLPDMAEGGLSRLPSDLLVLLADFLPQSSINALVQTCRGFFNILNHTLYSKSVRQHCSRVLQWGVEMHRVGTVRKALAAGGEVNPRKRYFQSNHFGPPIHPLNVAAESGDIEIASILIEAGALTDFVPEADERRPLQAAVRGGSLEMVKLIHSTGKVKIGPITRYDVNLLSHACQHAGIDVIRYILEQTTDANAHRHEPPLIVAVMYQRLDAIQLLLDSEKIDFTLVDAFQRTALGLAAEKGSTDTQVFELLLASGKFDVNAQNQTGQTTISMAAAAGNTEVVRILLARPEVNPNLANRTGSRPIKYALERGHIDTVKLLMASERVNIPANELFRISCERSSADVISELLKLDHAQPSSPDESGATWLHIAATYGRTDLVKLFLKQNEFSIDQQMNDGSTPLICAVRNKRRAATTALLKAGANVTIALADGWTALSYAVQTSNHTLVSDLLNRGCDINATDAEGLTPLHLACKSGEIMVVQVLLVRGSDAVLADNSGLTPLHLACLARWEQTVKLLLQHIPKGHAILRTGRTPLHDACMSGHTGISKLLLEHGADPMQALADGTTPLEFACQGHPVIAKMLLERGADPRHANAAGRTVLHLACKHNTPKVASLLLKNGADPNARDARGRTPFHLACFHGYLMLIRALLKYGADATATTQNMSTPLHEIARARYKADADDIVNMLIDKGAAVDARNAASETPLHLACIHENDRVVRQLVTAGADVLSEILEASSLHRITPIHLVSRTIGGSTLVPEMLAKAKSLPPQLWISNWTPLHEAARWAKPKNVEALLKHGADPAAVTEDGCTALHLVLRHADFNVHTSRLEAGEAARLLIETGEVDVNHKNESGKTALQEASNMPLLMREMLVEFGCV